MKERNPVHKFILDSAVRPMPGQGGIETKQQSQWQRLFGPYGYEKEIAELMLKRQFHQHRNFYCNSILRVDKPLWFNRRLPMAP